MVENGQNSDISDFSQCESNISAEAERFITLSAPVTLQWEVTPWCNEKCIHCYNYWRQDQNIKPTPTSETVNVWDKTVSEIIKNKVFHITATGGEPLAVFKPLYPFLEKLVEGGVGVGINTNLTMMNAEIARSLKKIGIKSILTSLSSSDLELNDKISGRKNTLKDITRGIKIAQNEGLWVAVNMVVTKKNLHDIYETAKYVKSLGIKNFSATKASAPIRDIDFSDYALSKSEFNFMLEELLRVKENLGLSVDSLEFYPTCAMQTQNQIDSFGGRMCSAGKTSCTIGFDGSIRPCSHAIQVYGSILNSDGLSEGWQKLQPWRVTSEFLPDKCNDCKVKTLCRGGCRTEAYVFAGSLMADDPYSDFLSIPLERKAIEFPVINKNDNFYFNPGVRYRSESFGAILFSTSSKWTPVDSKLYNFFEQRKSDFCLGELGVALGASAEAVLPTVQVLLRNKIIERR